MKRFAQAFVCLFVFALLCVVTDADCAFGAKGARGEKAAIERGSTKSKETKKVKNTINTNTERTTKQRKNGKESQIKTQVLSKASIFLLTINHICLNLCTCWLCYCVEQ